MKTCEYCSWYKEHATTPGFGVCGAVKIDKHHVIEVAGWGGKECPSFKAAVHSCSECRHFAADEVGHYCNFPMPVSITTTKPLVESNTDATNCECFRK